MLFKVPLLNITRNFRRTFLTCSAIAFGLAALVMFEGYFAYMIDGLRETTIRTGLGHVQVYQKGFEEFSAVEPEKYLLSEESVDALNEIAEAHENFAIASKQTNITGLLSNGKNSLPTIIVGAEADNINLINSAIQVSDGDLFDSEMLDGVNIGQGLARNLQAQVGDVFTLLATTAEGYVNAVDVTIVGIVTTGITAIDDRILYGNLEYVNRLYDVEAYSRMLFLLDETDRVDDFLQHLQKSTQSRNLEIEYKDWLELSDLYRQVSQFLGTIFNVLQVIIIVVVVFFINNTMIMNVMERVPEIGTLRAMGETKLRVVLLFLIESIYIGIIGGIIGIAIGYFTANAISELAIELPPPPNTNRVIPLLFLVENSALVKALVLCSITAFLAGIYPSIKASRMKITEALRYI